MLLCHFCASRTFHVVHTATAAGTYDCLVGCTALAPVIACRSRWLCVPRVFNSHCCLYHVAVLPGTGANHDCFAGVSCTNIRVEVAMGALMLTRGTSETGGGYIDSLFFYLACSPEFTAVAPLGKIPALLVTEQGQSQVCGAGAASAQVSW